MTFEIEPYVGASPLRFGMTLSEAERISSTSAIRSKTRSVDLVLNYESHNIGFSSDDNLLNHIGFTKGAKVIYNGIDFFGRQNSWKELISQETQLYECLGFLLFLDHGLALTGFHDDYEDELSVTAFMRGRYEKFRDHFKPWNENTAEQGAAVNP